MFIIASCVIGLGLEVEDSGKAMVWENSPLGSRVRVGQICRDCESEILGILLMVDLRVVDISGFDVLLDMDEVTAHRVVSDCDLKRVIIRHMVLELCKVAYACVWNFRTKFFFGGGRVSNPRKFKFSKNGKTIILVENRKVCRSQMTKWTLSLNWPREI